jgi:predicted nucleic acid-binding protein
LEILHSSYASIVTTKEVSDEFGEELPGWIFIHAVNNKEVQRKLELQLDKGEASAIALALETRDCSIILDDMKARKVAEKLGLEITGTLGVIVKAKKEGIIPSVKPFLAKLKETNFRLSADLEITFLSEAGE